MIFVDTSFWVATRLRRDDRRREAVQLLERFGGEPWVTTNHVLGETWTFMRRRAGHALAASFVEDFERSALAERVHVEEGLERDALRWLQEHDEREYSFVDATSFALMRARGIHAALAFDGDFAAAGFTELRAD